MPENDMDLVMRAKEGDDSAFENRSCTSDEDRSGLTPS